ncbi:MAG: T9SS type A sorting domain-containing protein [Ignavibacteria bacterium]|nr:T9SS type A sorting domain-containing protein [Ignavibacteria bacterium]
MSAAWWSGSDAAASFGQVLEVLVRTSIHERGRKGSVKGITRVVFALRRLGSRCLPACIAMLAAGHSHVRAQPFIPGTTYFGSDGYIEYHAGNTAFIVSVPHGGTLAPVSIPNRDCKDCSYGLDYRTQELAREFSARYAEVTGCSPHMVINLLHRRKLDMNRDITAATDSNAASEIYWQDYHGFIDSAKSRIMRDFGQGLFLEIHGHGHAKQRIEVGYLLRSLTLRQSDSVLNSASCIDSSAIAHLARGNRQSFTHAMLLRGEPSLGSMLARAGYPAVPSSQDPFPLPEDDYFNGGYNTLTHGSRTGGSIDAVQLELYSAIRSDGDERSAFVDSLVRIVYRFIALQYLEDGAPPCAGLSGVARLDPARTLTLYPNPARDRLHLRAPEAIASVRVYNLLGVLLLEEHDPPGGTIPIGQLPPGLYIGSIRLRDGGMLRVRFVKE